VSFLLLNTADAPPSPTGLRRTGRVTLDRKLWRDDGGPWNPRGISFFTWPWGLQHEPDRYRENIAWFARHGFDFYRTWGKVGGGSWADREFSVEREPDAMARAIDVAYDEFGLRTDVALIADNYDGRHPLAAAHALIDVIRPRLEAVICVEAANEDNMPDESTNLRRVCDALRSAFPTLPVVARSVATDFDAWPYANVVSIHTDRHPPPERQIRQHWDGQGLRRPVGSFEPPGPWSSVGTMDEPMHLACASAACSIMGTGLYVFHAGAGIRTGGQWDRDRGLPPNFWDQERGDAQASAVITARALLPGDIVSWRRINGHWPGHPLPARWVWSDGWPEGVSRIYAADNGAEFYCAVLAVKGESQHPVARDCHVEVLHPETGAVVESRDLRGGAIHFADVDGRREITGDGDTLILRGPESGGLWGYVIHGNYV
jgi:hypothetical protein